MMEVKFKSISEIKLRLGIEPYGQVHKSFADTCRRHMNERYVPKDEGNLRNTSFVDEMCNIVYPQPYAQFQYYGKLMVDPVTKSAWARKGIKKELTNVDLIYRTLGTGPYWDKKMVSAEIDDIVKEMQELIRRGGN